MDVPILTDSLVEFYEVSEIREIWKQVLDAVTGRVQLPLQINSRSRDGTSSGAIIVSTPTDASNYMHACKAAIARLESPPAGAEMNGTHADFSRRPVSV